MSVSTDHRCEERTESIETVGAVCYHAVVRALQYAAVRSPATGRSNGRNLGLPTHLIHTRVRLTEPDRLLTGAWETLDLVLTGDVVGYARVCDVYTKHLLAEGLAPDRIILTRLLAEYDGQNRRPEA